MSFTKQYAMVKKVARVMLVEVIVTRRINRGSKATLDFRLDERSEIQLPPRRETNEQLKTWVSPRALAR